MWQELKTGQFKMTVCSHGTRRPKGDGKAAFGFFFLRGEIIEMNSNVRAFWVGETWTVRDGRAWPRHNECCADKHGWDGERRAAFSPLHRGSSMGLSVAC